MELINRTPLEAFAFRQFDQEGELDCVVAVRGTFNHRQGERLVPAEVQEPFQWEDVYEGDPHQTIQIRQTDLVPFKPGTDVTFLGEAFAPGGQPLPDWTCTIAVGERLHKTLRVTGPRFWKAINRPGWRGLLERDPHQSVHDFELTEPQPANVAPLSWTSGYGGTVPAIADEREEEPDVFPDNPLGCGVVALTAAESGQLYPAPTIERQDVAIRNWDETYTAEGFGLVSPWWRQRQQHAGTYDDRWVESRHPLLPRDFDPRFWQCAHPDLVAIPWLEGDEAYRLTNLHPHLPEVHGFLPGARLGLHCVVGGDEGVWHLLNLDGVHFDFRRGAERVMLTWRARFALPDAVGARLTLRRVKLEADQRVEEARA